MPNENDSNTPASHPDERSQAQPKLAIPAPDRGDVRPHSNTCDDNQEATAGEMRREFRWFEWISIAINGALAIVGVLALIIYNGQLKEMRKSTRAAVVAANAAASAADTADKTLREIRAGSTDTHDLAIAAKSQADTSGRIADAAKSAAMIVKDTLRVNNHNFRIEQRPYVVEEFTDFQKNATGAETIHIRFGNVGKTPAVEFHLDNEATRVRIGDVLLTTTVEGTSSNVIGPERFQEFYFPYRLFEPYQADFDNSSKDLFVQFTAQYKDVLGCNHWTKVCLQYRKSWNQFRWCGISAGPNELDRNTCDEK